MISMAYSNFTMVSFICKYVFTFLISFKFKMTFSVNIIPSLMIPCMIDGCSSGFFLSLKLQVGGMLQVSSLL